MADLSGYGAISESMEVGWLHRVLDDYLKHLSECVIEHHGHIDKYVGDEIMAVFGYPVAREDAADLAVHSALAMMQQMSALNARNSALIQRDLALHIGINAGMVIAGSVGHESVGGHTFIGDTVNVAKRLESLAPAGDVYVSASVQQRVQGRFSLEPLGALAVRSRQETVEAYRVALDLPSSSRSQYAAAMELVGRERELRQLGAAEESCRSESAPYALITGDAGVGKTALAKRFLDTHHALGSLTVEVPCTPFGSGSPHWALAEMVTLLVEAFLDGGRPTEERGQELLVEACGDDAAALRALRELIALRSRKVQERQQVQADAIAHALRLLLGRLTRDRNLVALIDDAQYLDDASARAMANLVRYRPNAQVFFVLCTRDGRVPLGGTEPQTVHVPPLTDGEASSLLAQMPKTDSLSQSLRRSLINRAQGNPLYLSEMVQWLDVGRRQGLEGAAGGDTAPSLRLHEILLARVDAQPQPLPLLLQTCAVIGEPISPLLLHQLVPPETATPARFRDLVASGFLRPAGQPGEFMFPNQLVRDVIYESVPAPQRKDLHSVIAEYLAGEELDATLRHLLARHAYLAGWGERCVPHLLASAEAYSKEYANRDCVRAVGEALKCMASAKSPGDWHELRAKALLLLARGYHVLGEVEQARAALFEASVLAEEVADLELQAFAELDWGTNALMRQEFDEALDHFTQAREGFARQGDDGREAHALLGLGMTELTRDDPNVAFMHFRRADELGHETSYVRSAALNNMGTILTASCEYEAARGMLLEATMLIRAEGDRRGLAHCLASLGELALLSENPDQGAVWLTESSDLAAEIDDPDCFCLASALLARCLLAAQAPDEASAVLERVAAYREAIHDSRTKQHVATAINALASRPERQGH